MEFQTLSHAGLRVAAGGKELVCDPWLTGSVYWRSWWNYPPVPRSLVETLRPDFVYLTHLHWDHFQAASLRLFSPETPILVPYDRYGRMVRDLDSIGRKNVREVRHGERVLLSENFAITSFHFSPTITDSAIVIEADGVVLLNANDAKFAGMPLEQILKKFPNVDFCFRSHSSANARACYHYIDDTDLSNDNNERYLHAFSAFMARVRPRYAIPFASNSCLLHDDVFSFNDHVQTPLSVKNYFDNYVEKHNLNTKIKIMIPGDMWSDKRGFTLQEHDYFTHRDRHLAAYRQRVQGALDRQKAIEMRVTAPLGAIQKFFAKLSKDIPNFLFRPLRGRQVLMVATSGDRVAGFAVDISAGRVEQIAPDKFSQYDLRIEMPAIILRQAVLQNMFGHAAISKRVHYYATRTMMPALRRFVLLLDLAEAEIFPLRRHFTVRALRALLPRWREGVLYAVAALNVIRGVPLPEFEIKCLERQSGIV